jgi:hypothetical protein
LKGESVLTGEGEGEGVLMRLMDDGLSNRLEKGEVTVELLTGEGEGVLTDVGLSNRLEKGEVTVERLMGEDVLIELERLMGDGIFII